ncbi:tail fiber protein [Escherichia coli]|nr:tail fiber protein [Escherichia coli]
MCPGRLAVCGQNIYRSYGHKLDYSIRICLMNDVTVVTSVTYPSPESLALVADVQYHEPYLSAALNRKFRGIVDPGFYAGFLPKPGGGMNLLITSVDGDKTAGAASVDIGEFYQVTIQHRKDISLALNAGKKYAIVLKGRYLLGEDTYQVNTASHIHAAEFVARTYTDSYQLGDGELLVCTVNIPAGVSTITQEMIDTSERINRTIGIDISDSVTSTRSDVAASSLAVKKAYDLAKSKYTAQDASTTQKGLVQLSSATNSTSEVLAATPKAVKAAYDLANGKQAADATLTALAALATAADKLPYFTGVDRAALTALTSVGRAILGKTSIQSVLDYLGLGEAAKRDVGTGDNQIPDMGAFASGSGWFRLPGGYIVQFGTFSGNTTRIISGHFPIPFPNQPMVSVSVMSDAVQSDPSNPAPQVLSVNFEHISNSAWRVATSGISQRYRFSYISIGR